MKSILYDFYGIYIDHIEINQFIYLNINYVVYEVEMEEVDFIQLYQYYTYSMQVQNLPYLIAIRNKYGNYISNNLILFSFKIEKLEIEKISSLSLVTLGSTEVSLIKKEWIMHLDELENQYLPNIMGRPKQFDYLYALGIYYLGLGECALAYLQDYIPAHTKLDLGLCLKIEQLTNYLDFINPLNYHLDIKVSQISLLYNLNYLNVEQLEYSISQLSQIEIVFLLIKIIYPQQFFEQVKAFVSNQIDESYFIKKYEMIEIEQKRITDLYTIIQKYANIRPIEWLFD